MTYRSPALKFSAEISKDHTHLQAAQNSICLLPSYQIMVG